MAHEHSDTSDAGHRHSGHGHGGHRHNGHGHSHAPADFGRSFAIAVVLNTVYVATEAVWGLVAGSLALLADAAHNLTDVAGLLIAWWAHHLGKRLPSRGFTYGLGRASILAAVTNGVALMIAVGVLTWEAIGRFSAPQPVPGTTILWVALLGVAINTGTAMLFIRGSDEDLNIKGAYIHMAADAAVSLGVVLSAVAIIWTGYLWLDPLAALAISAVIAWSSFGLLRSALRLELDGVPKGLDRNEVAERLARAPGVASVHDVHIWALSTTSTAMTAHLVMPGGHPGDAFLHTLSDTLSRDFGIGHATLQIEKGDGEICALAPENVI